MRACWLKWVGWDWSISADYIWLIFSDANNWKTLEHIVIFRAEIKHSNVNARCLIRCISYMNKLMRDIFPIWIPRIVLSSN